MNPPSQEYRNKHNDVIFCHVFTEDARGLEGYKSHVMVNVFCCEHSSVGSKACLVWHDAQLGSKNECSPPWSVMNKGWVRSCLSSGAEWNCLIFLTIWISPLSTLLLHYGLTNITYLFTVVGTIDTCWFHSHVGLIQDICSWEPNHHIRFFFYQIKIVLDLGSVTHNVSVVLDLTLYCNDKLLIKDII